MSLFTELTLSEEASLFGGKSDTKPAKLPKTLVIITGDVLGAGGGASSASGGVVGKGKSIAGGNTGGDGVVINVK